MLQTPSRPSSLRAKPTRPESGNPGDPGPARSGRPPLATTTGYRARHDPSPRARWESWAAGAVTMIVAGLATVLAVARTPAPAGVGEAAVAANAYGLQPFGPAGLDLSWPGQVGSWQVHAFSWLTGGAQPSAALTDPSRAVVVLTAVLTALAGYTLCRRLAIRPWLAASAGVLSAAPISLSLARILDVSASLSVLWVVGGAALVLSAAQPRWLGWPVRALGLVAMTWGVIASPVHALLPAAVALGLALVWPLTPAWTRVERIGSSLVAGSLLLALLWATVAPADGRAVDAAGTEGLTAAATVAGALLLLLAAAVAILTPWARPLSVGSLPLAVVAFVPGPARSAGLILCVVLLALLGAILLDDLLSRPTAVGRIRRSLLAGAAALVAVGVVAAPATAADPVVRPDPNAIASWVEANLQPDSVLIVDELTRVDLVRVGLDPDRLRTEPPDAGSVPMDSPVGTIFRLGPLPDEAQLPLLAQFGSGTGAWGLRQVVADPEAHRIATEADRQARIRFGSALAQNPNVNFSTTARAQLRAGEVDARLLLVLAAATMDVRMSVPEFISTSADPSGAILRRVQLADVVADDSDLAAAVAIDRLADFLDGQQAPFAPSELRVDSRSLRVGYLVPTPLGLLG